MYKFCVVIPCFNNFKKMTYCIEALNNQSYKDFMVIFVDDSSKDDTYNNLLSYANDKPNVKVLRNEYNLGPSLSRKLAIDNSDAEYIVFCDADDCISTDCLAILNSIIETNESLDMIIYDNCCVYSDGSKIKQNITKNIINNKSKEKFLIYSGQSLCRCCIKYSIIKDIEFLPIRRCEDAIVTYESILKSKNIVAIDNALYSYYINNDSVSTTVNKDTWLDILTAFDRLKVVFNGKYKDELELIGIRLLLYDALLFAIKGKNSFKDIYFKIKKSFENDYPNWNNNKYINIVKSNKIKRILLFGYKYKITLLLWLMANLHTLYFKIKSN